MPQASEERNSAPTFDAERRLSRTRVTGMGEAEVKAEEEEEEEERKVSVFRRVEEIAATCRFARKSICKAVRFAAARVSKFEDSLPPLMMNVL